MAGTPLTHNRLNGVTADIWRQGDVVHKVLTRRREVPAHWAASEDMRHWNYWKREAQVYESGLPGRLGLGAPRLLGAAELPPGDIEIRLEHVERLPRTVCHLDVWPNNLIGRPNGEIVLLDWAFAGDGALGEDIGNLVPDSVFDLLFPHELLDELDARLTSGYVRGLRDAGWSGDERLVRLGICASAVKYDWLTVHCLEQAGADEQLDYGHGSTVEVAARYAARAAGLALCARWTREAEDLTRALAS
jgi:hypothetical protein